MSFPSWCRPAFASLFASTAFRLQKCCLRAVSCLGFQWCYPFPTSSFRIISFLRICCWEMPPPCCHLTDHLHPTDHRGVTHCGETDLLATCHLHRRDAGMDGPVETIHPDGERMFVPYEKETCAQPSLAHVHRITARGHVVSTHEPGLSRLRLGLEPELDVQSSVAQEGWSSGGNLGLSTPGLRLRASFLPSHLTTLWLFLSISAQSATVGNAGWTWNNLNSRPDTSTFVYFPRVFSSDVVFLFYTSSCPVRL